MNLRMSYQYRDGSNYKNGGSVVFSGMPSLPVEEFEKTLRKAFDDGENFVAAQIGVPELFHYLETERIYEEDDHGWHELMGLCESSHEATDKRNPDEFLAEVQRTKWDVKEAKEILAALILKRHEALARKKLGEHRTPITL